MSETPPVKRSIFPPPNDTVKGLVTALLVPAIAGGLGMWAGGAVQEERIASLQESFRAHRTEGHADTNRELVALQTRFDALITTVGEVRDELRQLRAKVEAMDARGRAPVR